MFAICLGSWACTRATPEPSLTGSPLPDGGRVDVGGFELAWRCHGEGSPTVILDAGLDTAGTSEWFDFLPQFETVGTRLCTYDRAGKGSSDPRPPGGAAPTAASEAEELHALLNGADIDPPYVLVPHSYAGLIARVYADRYPRDVAGFVFEDVSTAWEIDLWPRWDDSPWIDGGVRTDIDATERQVLDAIPLGRRHSAYTEGETSGAA